jgi:hypothetical protein
MTFKADMNNSHPPKVNTDDLAMNNGDAKMAQMEAHMHSLKVGAKERAKTRENCNKDKKTHCVKVQGKRFADYQNHGGLDSLTTLEAFDEDTDYFIGQME